MMRIHESYRNPFWTEDENIEMATRVMVRDGFSDLMGKRLSNQDLKSLERVLFGVVYPTLGCPPQLNESIRARYEDISLA